MTNPLLEIYREIIKPPKKPVTQKGALVVAATFPLVFVIILLLLWVLFK